MQGRETVLIRQPVARWMTYWPLYCTSTEMCRYFTRSLPCRSCTAYYATRGYRRRIGRSRGNM